MTEEKTAFCIIEEWRYAEQKKHNKVPHLTAFPLRSKAADELGCSATFMSRLLVE
jgi:hypothetical protein